MPVQPEATSATLEAMDADVVVIGAGVVGLAVASELAERGRDVLVLERHDAIGTETSSRNSEVIHAGIYYPEGSLKARWCVEGKALLYDFCARYGGPTGGSGSSPLRPAGLRSPWSKLRLASAWPALGLPSWWSRYRLLPLSEPASDAVSYSVSSCWCSGGDPPFSPASARRKKTSSSLSWASSSSRCR
ncbi:MAG: FAD-dependent oxidoreductase [Planctomycetota bacterium]